MARAEYAGEQLPENPVTVLYGSGAGDLVEAENRDGPGDMLHDLAR
jgi:hypothetical protein